MFLEQRHELYSLLSMPNFTKTEKLNFQLYRQSTNMVKICWEKLLLETVLVEEQLLTQWFWETSSSILSAKHTPILITAIGYITYKCSLIPPYFLLSFFSFPYPLEQCWATQINTYMNLTFSKPSIGGRVSHCFLFTTVQVNAIENLKFALETENVSTLLSRIVGNTCFPPGISHVVRQRFCCCWKQPRHLRISEANCLWFL